MRDSWSSVAGQIRLLKSMAHSQLDASKVRLQGLWGAVSTRNRNGPAFGPEGDANKLLCIGRADKARNGDRNRWGKRIVLRCAGCGSSEVQDCLHLALAFPRQDA